MAKETAKGTKTHDNGTLETDMTNIFNELNNSISNMKMVMTKMQTSLKDLEKQVTKHTKVLKKEQDKNKNKPNKAPSGFAKPTQVTSELCKFMNKEEGTKLARTEVTKALVSYIKEHKLEDQTNSKKILPDVNLKTLLGLDNESDELTYFNIQKYMNKHFIKETN